VFISFLISCMLFLLSLPLLHRRKFKNRINPQPVKLQTEEARYQGAGKPIKEIVISIENCFECPFSVKDPSCPYCCINKITFSSGIPEDKRCCEISTIILRWED
jgi:hypothetical protein